MLSPSPTNPGIRKLSDVARHLVLPSGIVSSGYAPVQHQLRTLGIEHDDWQQGLGRVVLAKRESGLYAAGIGGIELSTCRQVGKTFTFGSIIFALCILFPNITVLWTAHHSRTNDETYEALVEMARMPLVKQHISKVVAGNGKQSIQFGNGSRILFGAREHGFGRGIPGVSIVVFDEAQILSQRALNAMIPAANTVRNPLIIYVGTPPEPENPSAVFAGRRRRALDVKVRRDAGEDVGYDALYVEISADPDADFTDPVQRAKGNPSYPARTPEEAFQRLIDQLEDPASIRREGFGIWDEDGGIARAITAAMWKATAVDKTPPAEAPRRALGVAFSLDGSALSIAGAHIPDEVAHGELIDAFAGSMDDGLGGLADWMAERWRNYSGFVLSGRAGATVLEALLLARKVPQRRILVVDTPKFLKACSAHLDEIRAKTVTHLSAVGQTALDDAVKVTTTRKRTIDGGWSWTSPNGEHVHIEAVSLALYGARTMPARRARLESENKPKGRIL